MSALAPASAYRHCEAVTRRAARNFYWGMRLLPPPRRDAIFAVYALARRIDDIADGELDDDAKLAELEQVRASLGELDGAADDSVLVALADAVARYPIPLDAFVDMIDGAEMDVRGTEYARWDDLLLYCRRVGGSTGRLSLGVFATDDRDAASRHADILGVALQLTNILRDLREDLALGRSYLPAEDLDRYGCDAGLHGPPGAVAGLVRFEADRAERCFADGLRILPLLDRRSAACVAAMAGVYRRLLARIERDPEAVLERRLSLPGWEKGWVAARSLTGAAP